MIEIDNEASMQRFGERLGEQFFGGEVVELVGDVGAGKTTLVRGIAKGMGVDETVQSPSFTISRVYDAAKNRRLVHYDFYRLSDPGIMAGELAEAMSEPENVVIIEWADTVGHILPTDRLTIHINTVTEAARHIHLHAEGDVSAKLAEKIT